MTKRTIAGIMGAGHIQRESGVHVYYGDMQGVRSGQERLWYRRF